MENIGLILFDIDGVIRSVENSYRLSLKKTVFKFSGWEPSYKDIDCAKNEGIWNNDWDLSLELIKRVIKKKNLKLKVPSRKEIVKCFEEFYFGGDPNKDSKYWSGFITNEDLLVDKTFFDFLKSNGIIWGFVSGAESASAKFVLEKRIEGALVGDFVIALFNPQSIERNWQLKSVIDICLQTRHGDTPVLIARQVGRENQSKKFFTLNTIPIKEIDMLSIIIIGNSQTTLVNDIFLTPRGYLQN